VALLEREKKIRRCFTASKRMLQLRSDSLGAKDLTADGLRLRDECYSLVKIHSVSKIWPFIDEAKISIRFCEAFLMRAMISSSTKISPP